MAGKAVFEDSDASDTTKGGEELVEIGIGEGEIEVGDVDSGFGGSQAT
jgi:hypothetical protein